MFTIRLSLAAAALMTAGLTTFVAVMPQPATACPLAAADLDQPVLA